MAENRESIEERLKWRLEDIYASDKDFEQDLVKLDEMFMLIPKIKKSLTKNAHTLAKALRTTQEMEHIAAKLFIYARMRRDEDNSVAKYQAMVAQATDINVRLSSALSFMNPALLGMKGDKLAKYAQAGRLMDGPHDPKTKKKLKKLRAEEGYSKSDLRILGEYAFSIEELLRSKPHVLNAKGERLLAMAGQVTTAPKEIFSMLNDADLKFGEITNEHGEQVPLTHGSYIVLMQSPDREVRKQAYDQLYGVYRDYINTISTTYISSVRKDTFVAQAKRFPRAIDRALFSDNVPVALYDRLISIIHDNLDVMHRYVALRKRVLGVDELHMYDVYAPLVPDQTKQYPFDEAFPIVREGLAALGEDYQHMLDRAVNERWIDVEETPGKTSGAYSWGIYGVHPYVLLNHRSDLDSVFTIAHELGHAMHSYYSNLAQPEARAGYSIFVAEVASTVNEILLTQHLLKTVEDRSERLYILNHYLDQFRTTVVRQTMFAEFEQIAHATSENGVPLTYESLCKTYGELNALYYGDEMKEDDKIIYEWARIPHFYNAFYVYKYATGFSCAVKIATDLTEGKSGAELDYRRFLSSGGSDYPLELLKIAHVDLVGGEPIRACMRAFNHALDEFEQLLDAGTN